MYNPPIKQPSKCVPFTLCKKVEQLVDDVIEKKVVHLLKNLWTSPVVLVAKTNERTRFCVDYRKFYLSHKDGCLSST